MPYYRNYGGIPREIDTWTNYAGKDFIVITNITTAERDTLGEPEPESYALCDGVEPLAWNPETEKWENFFTVLGIPVNTGPQGEVGPEGPKGDMGATGATGAKGDKGDKGDTGPAGTNGTNGTNGVNGVGASPGAPVTMTVSIGTAYQAPDNTKASHINLMFESNYTTTLAGTSSDELEVRIGPTNAVTGATGGYQAATWKTSLTGIALTVGLGIIQRSPTSIMLPPGWYFCVRRLAGTTAVINSTIAQPLS